MNITKNKKTPWQIIRRYLIILLVALELYLMFGGYDKNGHTYQLIGQHIANFMKWMLGVFNDASGVGFAIIFLTAILRLVLMPIMLSQQKQSTIQAEKMAMLKPQLDLIQKEIKSSKDPKEQMALQAAMMKIYSENNLSMLGGINMLSMLIQLPAIQGLYSAIHLSNVVKGGHFFNIPLDKPSIIVALTAFVLYFAQSYFMILNTPEEQRSQMKIMMWISPVMIFVFSYTQSASLGLYFVVGGIFMLIQTLIMLALRPKLKKEARDTFKVKDVASDLIKQAKENPDSMTSQNSFLGAAMQQQVQKNDNVSNKTQVVDAKVQDVTTNKNKNRNKGKQRGHK
jgi:YidC/Oxa1 family membrane protein insertase